MVTVSQTRPCIWSVNKRVRRTVVKVKPGQNHARGCLRQIKTYYVPLKYYYTSWPIKFVRAQVYFFVPRPRYRLPAQCNFMLISAFFSFVILLFCFLFSLKTAFYIVVMQLQSCLVAFWSTAKRSSLLQCF